MGLSMNLGTDSSDMYMAWGMATIPVLGMVSGMVYMLDMFRLVMDFVMVMDTDITAMVSESLVLHSLSLELRITMLEFIGCGFTWHEMI